MKAIFDNDTLLDDLIKKWNEILPYSFYYNHLDAMSQIKITNMLNKFYFGNEAVSDAMRTNKKGLIDVSKWLLGYKTSKNVVKYDPLKRIFLERFLYGTKLSTNLRSFWASIDLINISAKFRLNWTTGTCIYPWFLIFGMSSMKELDFLQT